MSENVLTFEGRQFRVAKRSIDAECLFSKWVRLEALAHLRQCREAMVAEEWQMSLDGWRNDGAAHRFDFGGPLCAAAMLSVSGAKQLAFLTLSQTDGEVTPSMVDRLFADADAWCRFCDLVKIAESAT